MLTYQQLIELRDKFLNAETSLEAAKEICWGTFKEGQRSWHTKDWKERRAKVIKDACEICTSKEIIILQHLSHPKKYVEHLKELTTEVTRLYIESNPVIDASEFRKYILNKFEYVPVPICPNCKSRNPNKRSRKTPFYLCTQCRHEFDETISLSVDELLSIFHENEESIEVRDKCFRSNDQWGSKNNLSNIRYWFQRDKAKTMNADALEKKAFLLYLDDVIKYLSFEDTITACKKCASYFDLLNMELCPKCRKYYKGVNYACCVQCLPEEKRKIALDKIRFGKQMRDMHRDLGID
jgi:hypothetical protein